MTDSILLEREGAVAEVVLNRPARKNALSPEAMTALTDVLRDVADDSAVGAVLIRGADGFFSSGLDLKEISTGNPPTPLWIAAHTALAALDVPVVGALTGGAINAGAALALACDLLVVGEQSYLQVKEAEMGMTPPVNAAWLGMRYPASVGLQLALSCRRFPGPELHRLGIALDVVADDAVLDHARGLATTLAGFPNRGAARTKRALRDARGEPDRPFASVVEAALASRRSS